MNIEVNFSPEWIEEQERLWRRDPKSVPPGLRAFFEGFELALSGEEGSSRALRQSAVQSLIYRYRDIGHLVACTDPLSPCPADHPLLSLQAFGLGEEDLDRTFHTRRFLRESATLREILDLLRETYCRTIGVEFMHIQDPDERQWLIERMESVRNRPDFAVGKKRAILQKLQEATLFENLLHRKFLGQKRFSLEGGETLIPVLDQLVRRAVHLGVDDLILGTSHRGRLNVLANIFEKPLENIFSEFEDNVEYEFVGEGDVKYHKGFSTDKSFDDKRIHLTMTSNPSHLEAVDPVVEGKCRARQDVYGEEGRHRVLPVLIHGDAAFAGQGMVAETLNLSQLEGYSTGGTLHLVLNNQIGFTTTPRDARSTRYATDVARMLAVPIFHVHGEDPEAAVHMVELALDYRRQFGRDVVLEIICFRRHGHNEGDEPYFTQPLMYDQIKDRPPVHEIYARRLVEEGVFPAGEIEEMTERIEARLEEAAESGRKEVETGFQGKWHDIDREFSPVEVDTAVEQPVLRRLAEDLISVPEGFQVHPKIDKVLKKRRESVLEDDGIDWGTAEALAFASLLAEGIPVRLSGQDSRRGTFSQRHSTLFDTSNGEPYVPFSAVTAEGARFQVYDSDLAEASVLGFEYGYALETPYGLVIWEAQFGDFANGAQVIIDQFVVSSMSKWDRVCGLTMFLPHGYEGQGAEHSSARIERFLQSCANDNIEVVNPSLPAQFFHLLRRQVKQSFRRPLIVFTPKSLLRHPLCVSSVEDFASGGFREILPAEADPEEVQSVLLCSGKIYFELLQKRQEDERKDVALIRIEQLYPLRRDLLEEALGPFGKAQTFAWVQEEPRNMGAWSFIRPFLAEILGRDVNYVGRDNAAAPAVGSHRMHNEEQKKIIQEAFALEKK